MAILKKYGESNRYGDDYTIRCYGEEIGEASIERGEHGWFVGVAVGDEQIADAYVQSRSEAKRIVRDAVRAVRCTGPGTAEVPKRGKRKSLGSAEGAEPED